MDRIRRLLSAIVFAAFAPAAAADEGMAELHSQWFSYVEADRLEYQQDPGGLLWDLQGWTGGDYHKLWWKSEGTQEDGSTRSLEVQLLYSRAISPYFDLQVGLRHDTLPEFPRDFAVLGLQGLLPYRIELDAAAFLSDDGDLSARLEAEYELLLTQRLILKPRAELRFAAQEVRELRIGRGLSTSGIGLRLRYEMHRKLAPYVGLTWQKSWGDTADFARAAGDDDNEVSFLAGLSFWF
jgi:copper resistance protein B